MMTNDYPVVLGYHTHAKGQGYGWFASAVHPAHLDSIGQLVMGTEWRVLIDRTGSLSEAVDALYWKVDAEMVIRNHGELITIACASCDVTIPVTTYDGALPTVVHPPKKTGKQHRVEYN